MNEPMTASLSDRGVFTLPPHRTRWNHRPLSRMYEQGVVYCGGRYRPVADAMHCCINQSPRLMHAQVAVSLWDGMFFCLDELIERIDVARQKLEPGRTHDADIKEIVMMSAALGGLRDACVHLSLVSTPASTGMVARPRSFEICAVALPFIHLDEKGTTKKSASAQVIDCTRTDSRSWSGPLLISHDRGIRLGIGSLNCSVADTTTLIQAHDGCVISTPNSPFFALVDGKWFWCLNCDSSCVMQRSIAELMQQIGLVTCEERVSMESLLRAEEIFITTDAGGVLPIAALNNERVGNGEHVVTTRIFQEFWKRRADGWLGSPAVYLPEF